MAPEEGRAPDDGDLTDNAEASNKRPRLDRAEGDSLEDPKGSEVPVPPNSSDQPRINRPRVKYSKMVEEIEIEPAFVLSDRPSRLYQFPLTPEMIPPRRKHQKPRYAFKDGLTEEYPPLHNLREIFYDLAQSACALGFRDVTDHLKNRPLRVATMCSGSDAPIYGLMYLQDALQFLPMKYQFKFVHLFSVEIEPYKQSFITRNLGVMCFRDVREVAAYPDGGKPTTASGGVADVPGNLDLVLAGFACVDYSSLNRAPKKFNEVGQSSDTLRAILTYCVLHRPKLVLLENIKNAPWDDVTALIENETSYSAAMTIVNTKNYYLPQTRQRGYLVMVEQGAAKGRENAERIAKRWAKTLKEFERPASSPVEDFVFKQDDPRMYKAQNEMVPRTPPIRRDWNLSKGRHQRVRAKLGLGQQRPVTNWIEGGRATAPDFGSRSWTGAQVHRVLDCIDINFLRSLWRGFDPFYKGRFWNLSQNVDRETDSSRFGLVGCLTPKANLYMTLRGAPMTGAEFLALQGLNISKISITRETQKELIDLAGNAMSTTVSTAAIVNLLICYYQILDGDEGNEDDGRKGSEEDDSEGAISAEEDTDEEDTKEEEVDFEGISKTRPSISMSHFQLQEPQPLPLETGDSQALLAALSLAAGSLRMCSCEGPDRVSNQPIDICTKCGHTACQKCSGQPKHYYGRSTLVNRAKPSEFRDYILKALPTRLYMGNFDLFFTKDMLTESILRSLPTQLDWRLFSEALNITTNGLNGELRYDSVERAHDWTIVYAGVDFTTRLELKINADKQMCWYYYLLPDERLLAPDRTRLLLKYPIAKMSPTNAENPLSGQWKFRIAPNVSSFWVGITGSGSLVASWLSRQGLERAANERVWDNLQVQICDYENPDLDGYDINGRYELLQECGTSHGSLYKKVGKGSKEPTIFLFHDPEHYSRPEDDYFVFATTSHRRKYGESRDVIATLDPDWWPSEIGEKRHSFVRCRARRSWVDVPSARLAQDFSDLPGRFWWACHIKLDGKPCASIGASNLKSVIWPSVSQFWKANGSPLGDCSRYYVAILLCKIPLQLPETYGWTVGGWQAFNTSKDYMPEKVLDWLFAKAKTLLVSSNEWKAVQLPTDLTRCQECTPKEPFIRWERRTNGKRS